MRRTLASLFLVLACGGVVADEPVPTPVQGPILDLTGAGLGTAINNLREMSESGKKIAADMAAITGNAKAMSDNAKTVSDNAVVVSQKAREMADSVDPTNRWNIALWAAGYSAPFAVMYFLSSRIDRFFGAFGVKLFGSKPAPTPGAQP